MKNHLALSIFILLLTASAATAQVKPGQFSISAGIALEPVVLTDKANMNTPPLTLKAGWQISQLFSLYATAGYSSTMTSPSNALEGLQTQVSNKNWMAGLRAEVRKECAKKLDMYGGAMLGFAATSRREFYTGSGAEVVRNPEAPTPFKPNAPAATFIYTGFFGSAYYLKNKVGIFAELGYGVSLLHAGVTVRL